MKYDKKTIADMARDGVLMVKFQKTDGTLREMKCTLLQEYLPKLELNDGLQSEGHPNVLAVWDVEANGWRSFRIESVQDVKQLLTEG